MGAGGAGGLTPAAPGLVAAAATRYNRGMTTRPRDLTSETAANHRAEALPSEAELRATDVRSGGDPARAPRTLRDSELLPDDEAIAASDDWDDPERL